MRYNPLDTALGCHARKVAAMVFVYAAILTLVNLGFWFGIMFNLPGTWLM